MSNDTKPTFVVYIDESGDEGFCFNKGSSKWFVLSAAIVLKERDLETVKLIDEVRTKLGREGKVALHFRNLRHEQRIPFVNKISEANKHIRAISVIIHKPSLMEPETFQEPHRLYFYSVRYLLERVSWLCRDNKKQHKGDGSAKVVFSNRSSMPYEELRDYFRRLRRRTGYFDIRVEWSVIKENQIFAQPARNLMGLQIADAVASSFYFAVEPSQYGHTEERYAKILKPVVYHRYGNYLGYGLKFWPWGPEKILEEFEWVRENYK